MTTSDPLDVIQADHSKALRAPKTTEKAKELSCDPRTAIRHVGRDSDGVNEFQVVTTKTESFPEGADCVTTCGLAEATHWAEANDPDVIEVADEDGFEDVDAEREVVA